MRAAEDVAEGQPAGPTPPDVATAGAAEDTTPADTRSGSATGQYDPREYQSPDPDDAVTAGATTAGSGKTAKAAKAKGGKVAKKGGGKGDADGEPCSNCGTLGAARKCSQCRTLTGWGGRWLTQEARPTSSAMPRSPTLGCRSSMVPTASSRGDPHTPPSHTLAHPRTFTRVLNLRLPLLSPSPSFTTTLPNRNRTRVPMHVKFIKFTNALCCRYAAALETAPIEITRRWGVLVSSISPRCRQRGSIS